jgi:hypothetical protein
MKEETYLGIGNPDLEVLIRRRMLPLSIKLYISKSVKQEGERENIPWL